MKKKMVELVKIACIILSRSVTITSGFQKELSGTYNAERIYGVRFGDKGEEEEFWREDLCLMQENLDLGVLHMLDYYDFLKAGRTYNFWKFLTNYA